MYLSKKTHLLFRSLLKITIKTKYLRHSSMIQRSSSLGNTEIEHLRTYMKADGNNHRNVPNSTTLSRTCYSNCKIKMKLSSFQHSTFNLVLLHYKFGDPAVQNSGQNVSLGPSRAYVTYFSLL